MKICHTLILKYVKMSKEAIIDADCIYHNLRAEKKLTEYKIRFKNEILGILS